MDWRFWISSQWNYCRRIFQVLLICGAILSFATAGWGFQDNTSKGSEKDESSEEGSQAQAEKTDDETTAESVSADEDLEESLREILEGHSAHGDAFNEGPRQRAYLMGGTGNVRFPVTTESKEAQAFIEQGVGQLHGFWYLEAERSFRHAAALDEKCAMAYWGAAMAAYEKRDRARGFIKKAVELIDTVTDREKMYIEALDKYFSDKEKSKRWRQKERRLCGFPEAQKRMEGDTPLFRHFRGTKFPWIKPSKQFLTGIQA